MSFQILTDSASNLPADFLKREQVGVIPFSFTLEDGSPCVCDHTNFDGKKYYDSIRKGARVITSQINPSQYRDFFEENTRTRGALYVSMSSGISGSCHSAELGRELLLEDLPDRQLRLVDSLGASLGEGLLVMKAAQCRAEGMTLDETADLLLELRKRVCQVFTVDELKYLRRTGRLSNAAAIIGTVLQIKPLLKGNEEGKIVSFAKVRGRKASIEGLAKLYDGLVRDPETQTVGIAHADCREDAETLIRLLNRNHPPKEIVTVMYDPVTGSHVGPGTLALFFLADPDVRGK